MRSHFASGAARHQNAMASLELKKTACPALLFVDDRPTTLASALFARRDVLPILLRVRQVLSDLPDDYVHSTSHLPCFILDADRPQEQEKERFLAWQQELGITISYFCNPSEPRQAITQRFARSLALPALSKAQVSWLREKDVMKEKIASIGHPVARFKRVAHSQDIVDFADRYGWPVIVKPIDGFACIETQKLNGPTDLPPHGLSSDRRWMVEEFIAAKEYECCALIFNGTVLDAYLSYFPSPPLQATDGDINANISMRFVPPDFPLNMKKIIQTIVDGMGLDHGYLHMELFLARDGQYWISEVALRLAGCEIPANHGLAYGFPIFDALIDIHMGRMPALNYTERRFVGDLLLPIRPGLVTGISTMDEIYSLQGVISGRLKVKQGDIIPKKRASHFSSGYVHVEGDSVEQVEMRMRNILDIFRIEVDDKTESC